VSARTKEGDEVDGESKGGRVAGEDEVAGECRGEMQSRRQAQSRKAESLATSEDVDKVAGECRGEMRSR